MRLPRVPRQEPSSDVRSAKRDTRARFLAASSVAAAILLMFLLVLAMLPRSSEARVTIAKVVLLALSLAVVVSCSRTARRAPGYNRRVWSLLTATGVCWTAAQVVAFQDRQRADAVLVAAPAHAVALLAVVPAVWALVSIPPEYRTRSERSRVWLGASIVVASMLLFTRSLMVSVAPPTLVGSVLSRALQVILPVSYALLACLIWIILLRVGTKGRMPLFLVCGGLVGYAWAYLYFAYHLGTGRGLPQEGLFAGSAWCYLMFILAAVSPHAADPRQPAAKRAKGRYVGLYSLLVYVPVMATTIAVSVLPRTRDPLVIAAGLLVLLLFGARQVLFSVDNSRLRDDLESRLDDLVQRSSELRRLGLQNERIVQSVVDGVIGVNAEGVLTFANPAAAAMLGYRRDELLGRHEEDLFHGDAEAHSRSGDDCCVVRTALTTGVASVSAADFFLAATGRVFPVELAVGPILEDGLITGAVVVFRDVSERRKIDTMKNEFVSVVSHELRTPLTSIRGSLGLLAGGAAGLLSTKADRMVNVALESSERLTRLINDMLDIERIESGTMPVQLADCQPRELINTAVDSIRGITGNHRIMVKADPDLPAVSADADRIVQTLTNLIGNAIKFSPDLTTITISAVRTSEMVEFAVADQGRGIPADKLDRIFERFEQVDSSDSREMGGTGLGLAISRTIVRRHGGDLTVTSRAGAGSTFRFSLPAAGAAGQIVSDSRSGALPFPTGHSSANVSGSGSGGHEVVGLPNDLPDVKTQRLAN